MMRKRLEWRGFNIKDVEKWDNQQYDVISMLNLLDRAGNPDQFIQKVSARRTKTSATLRASVRKTFSMLFLGSFGVKSKRDIAHCCCVTI